MTKLNSNSKTVFPTPFHNPSHSLLLLMIVYALAFLTMLYGKQGSALVKWSVAISAVIPYIIPFLWFGSFDLIKKCFDPVWIKLVIFLIGLAYFVASGAWASSLINNVFGIAASNFLFTSIIVPIAYLPIHILPFILSWILILISIVLPFYLLWIIFLDTDDLKLKLLRGGKAMLLLVYLGFLFGSTGFLFKTKDKIVEEIALQVDFDSKHRCTNLKNSNVDKVIHIGNGEVLAHAKQKQGMTGQSKNLFTIYKCDDL